MELYQCCQCNQPVDQLCCELHTPKLKKGAIPTLCPLSGNGIPKWKLLKSRIVPRSGLAPVFDFEKYWRDIDGNNILITKHTVYAAVLAALSVTHGNLIHPKSKQLKCLTCNRYDDKRDDNFKPEEL
jgi:hypothetical protein